jgi:hypothetical protein
MIMHPEDVSVLVEIKDKLQTWIHSSALIAQQVQPVIQTSWLTANAQVQTRIGILHLQAANVMQTIKNNPNYYHHSDVSNAQMEL